MNQVQATSVANWHLKRGNIKQIKSFSDHRGSKMQLSGLSSQKILRVKYRTLFRVAIFNTMCISSTATIVLYILTEKYW